MMVLMLTFGVSSTSAQKNHNVSFIPKEVWKDTDGNMINAHGAGLMKYKGTWYMYGEYKVGKTSR